MLCSPNSKLCNKDNGSKMAMNSQNPHTHTHTHTHTTHTHTHTHKVTCTDSVKTYFYFSNHYWCSQLVLVMENALLTILFVWFWNKGMKEVIVVGWKDSNYD